MTTYFRLLVLMLNMVCTASIRKGPENNKVRAKAMDTVKEAYTAQELAPMLDLTERAVRSRAHRESWHSRPRAGRGGGKEWLLASMPAPTRQSIAAAIAQRMAQGMAQHAPAALIAADVFTVNSSAAPATTLASIPAKGQQRAAARALLVNMAREFGAAAGQTRTVAYEVFAHEYNRDAIPTPAWVREQLPRVCRASLRNWEQALAAQGIASLAGRQGQHRKGKGTIDATPGMADVVIANIIKFRGITAEEVLDALEVAFPGQPLPALRSLQRWMRQYRAQNEDIILKIQNPDGWRNKYQAASGSRSEDICTINQRWELDSSPADILLSDGKRYTLMGGIDVGTRRARLYLAKTSNSQGVCSLLRRCLLDFGMPETLKMDNGADYTSVQVTTVIHDLHIVPEYCAPFHPEQKPHIERFFKTFQRSLKRLSGFIGHSVADRKAIESQRSFAERISRKKGDSTSLRDAVELNYTPEEFQAYCDLWCPDVYGERRHSSLGMSPNEAAARQMGAEGTVRRIENERALDILLMPLAGNGGIRTVRKKGISAAGGTYTAPELGAYDGQDVLVRMDEDNAGYIHVFTLDGLYICRAEDPALTGASRRDLALARSAMQKAVVGEKVKEAKKIVAKVKPQELVPLILDNKQRKAEAARAERAAAYPAQPERVHTTPALDQAALAALAERPAQPAPMTAQEAAARQRMEDDWYIHNIPAFEATPDDLASKEAFVTYRSLMQRQRTGGKLAPAETRWLMGYQSTTHCAVHIEMFKDFGEAMLDGVQPFAITG